MEKLNVVVNLNQVKQNLLQYNKELQEDKMTIRPNSVQQWYYIMDLDMFGPSRYIGYQDIDINQYNLASSLNGGITTYALSKWFNECDDLDLYEKLIDKLTDYFSQYDLDVRRNSRKEPSFKINLLKEDIPKLKQLYLSEKLLSKDTKCQTCNKLFWEEPFYAHHNRGPFCSQKCMPVDSLDQYKALEYVNHVEMYREVKEAFYKIENVTMRDELIEEISQVFVQVGESLSKDFDSEYKTFIAELLPKFEKLYDETWDYYMDNSHLDIQQAIRIRWHSLMDEGVAIEDLKAYSQKLEEQLKEVNKFFEVLYFKSFYIDHGSTNTIFYRSYHVTNETDLLLERIYSDAILFLSNYELEQASDNYIDKTLVAVCPKCSLYETLEDFSIDEDLNLFCCQRCI